MARPTNRLSAKQVAALPAGLHADGGGLYLQVTKAGGRSWIFRYRDRITGRNRDMGLGSVSVVPLRTAREAAHDSRRLLAEGKDPLRERKLSRSAGQRLWGDAVDDFIQAHKSGWKTEAQENQWAQSLREHGPDRDLPVLAIDTQVVLTCLRKIWKPRADGGKPETATRIRGRIERVWDAERVAGTVSGENPARWKGHLQALLPVATKLKQKKNFAAMPYADVGAFYQALRFRTSRSAIALRLVMLTVVRTEEATGCDWPEFDLEAREWHIPGARTKTGKPHIVPLVPEVVELLRPLDRSAPPFDLSENAMLYLLQRAPPKGLGQPYTVHGFRSTFSDWAHETTDFPNHVIEMALGHAIKNQAEAAYRRGALLDHRRRLMQAWADHLAARPARQASTSGGEIQSAG